ncbi:hypothetical protein ACHAP3_002140 [Botrytis cinerea]
MHSSHTKQEDAVLPTLYPKSKRSLKTFLSPYHPRQLSKLLSLTPLRSSPIKPPVKPIPEFHFFSQLPSEIRAMIWAIYFTFPRIHITALGSQPTAPDPWPLMLSRSPHLHPSLLISHESRSIYQQTCWLETLQRMHIHPQPQISHPATTPFGSNSFLAYPGSDLVNWDTDIFWFKGIPTVKKLSIGYSESHMQRYEDVRKVALDYAVLDYEEDSYYWRKRFKVGWYGLVCVLYLFECLEEVYFVLDVEGGKGAAGGDTEVSFEMVDAEERVRRRLEDVKREVDKGGDGLRFPQLDDRGMYPGLERLFSRRERGYGWKVPKIRFVYARNIG